MHDSLWTDLPGARPQTPPEERANVLSHGVGFVAAAAAGPMLADVAARLHGPAGAFGMAVFSWSAMLVFAASMLYHALPRGRVRRWARRIDHAAIFVFIAGSYTPFALGPLYDGPGLPLLAAVWAVAAIGVGCKLSGRLRHRRRSTLLYALLGWMALGLLPPLAERGGIAVVALLLAGGAAYTVGIWFYLHDQRVRYAHFAWHVAVLGGSACHVLAAVAPAL
ncbi:MAG: hemolysin III family protein [Rubrivivax sp.]